jgi:metal-sulfur cluster biosynthetic enzyme
VHDATVRVVFDPPWTPERISEAGRFEMDMLGIPDVASFHDRHRYTGLTIGRKPARPS